MKWLIIGIVSVGTLSFSSDADAGLLRCRKSNPRSCAQGYSTQYAESANSAGAQKGDDAAQKGNAASAPWWDLPSEVRRLEARVNELQSRVNMLERSRDTEASPAE